MRVYTKPPIEERIVGVYTDIPQQTFESLLPSWADKIKSSYPRSEPEPHWEINFETVNGLPVIQNAVPRARIIHLFWQRHPKNQKVKGMRVRPDRLVFHLEREENDIHAFSELIAEMDKWLKIWMEHFGVNTLRGITLEYVNRLDNEMTPQFVNANGSIRVSEAFSLFTSIPGKHHAIVPPYDCQLRLAIDEKMPCFFDVRVMNQPPPRLGLRIDMSVNTVVQTKSIPPEKALEEVQFAHTIMLEQFDCFFTEKAKESFA